VVPAVEAEEKAMAGRTLAVVELTQLNSSSAEQEAPQRLQ
jgi:hypothetical protein